MLITLEDKSSETSIRKLYRVQGDNGKQAGRAEVIETHDCGYLVDYSFAHDGFENKVAFGTLEGAYKFVADKIEQARRNAAGKEGKS